MGKAEICVNSASRIMLEKVCVCLWESWWFHNNVLLMVAWLRAEGQALCRSTVGCSAQCGRSTASVGLLTGLVCMPDSVPDPGDGYKMCCPGPEYCVEAVSKAEELWAGSLFQSSCKLNSPQRKEKIQTSICKDVFSTVWIESSVVNKLRFFQFVWKNYIALVITAYECLRITTFYFL